jgi:hypothetical protein
LQMFCRLYYRHINCIWSDGFSFFFFSFCWVCFQWFAKIMEL